MSLRMLNMDSAIPTTFDGTLGAVMIAGLVASTCVFRIMKWTILMLCALQSLWCTLSAVLDIPPACAQ